MTRTAFIPTPHPVSAHANAVVLPNLDGIRAAACLCVVLSHMPLPGKPESLGSMGVAIFFVLSGFLMSYLYGQTPWNMASVARYCIARFSRIAPIYWLVVTLCIVLSYSDPYDDFPMQIVGAYQITRHYFFAGSGYVFWSIPPEIQYYVFFLLIWWVIIHHTKRIWALPLLALLCSALVLTHGLWPGLALPSKLHLFLAGSVVGLLPRQMGRTATSGWTLSILQCGAALLILAPIWLFSTQAALYAAPEVGAAFAIGIYLLSIPSRWTTAVFASSLMRAIGRASFSIYLMHVVVFHFGMRLLHISRELYDPLWWPLGCAAVVLPMLVSRIIEIPLQRATRHQLEVACGLATPRSRQAA